MIGKGLILTAITAILLYKALAAILNDLATRYADYRFAHPPKPPTTAQIARRKLTRQICCAIYLIPWALLGAAVFINIIVGLVH
jgi:hypothetical protein